MSASAGRMFFKIGEATGAYLSNGLGIMYYRGPYILTRGYADPACFPPLLKPALLCQEEAWCCTCGRRSANGRSRLQSRPIYLIVFNSLAKAARQGRQVVHIMIVHGALELLAVVRPAVDVFGAASASAVLISMEHGRMVRDDSFMNSYGPYPGCCCFTDSSHTT